MQARFHAGAGNHVGVLGGQFVKRSFLLHMGQHQAGVQALAHQPHAMAHGIQRGFRSIHCNHDSEHVGLLGVD
ncbi:hypothetical protein D3C78_1401250 [compost metagenome]